MTVITEVWVPGVPKTKGSLDFHGSHAEENIVGSKRWRMLVVSAVRADLARRSIVGELHTPHNASADPIHVTATFFTAAEPTMPAAGDLDKLVRNVLDACSLNRRKPELGAGAYADDRQVVLLSAAEVPADDLGPGLLLRVSAVAADHLAVVWAAAIHARTLLIGR